ncbi:MAG: NADPH:quinone reductase [Marinovum sp.]|nr:NADPH:quinone reductase [Marinovum sp.]
MRAVVYRRFGAASQVLSLEHCSNPLPQAGEVLVKIKFSGANPSDVKSRAGSRPGVTKPAYEMIIPHSDGAGTIEAVGAGVEEKRIGQRVWIWNGQWGRALGTAAEYIALPADQAVEMPSTMEFESGATLGIPGLTAAHCVFGGGAVEGQSVLISGGAGSVAHNAIQLAKWGGARVIATASPGSFDRVKDAGADHVLDYSAPDLAKQISAIDPNGIDRAVEVEFGLNAGLLGRVMRPSGTIAAYGSALKMNPVFPFGPYLFKAITVDIVLVYILKPEQRSLAITKLHDAFAHGALSPAVHKIYPLQDCVKAHEQIERGGRSGAVLLAP